MTNRVHTVLICQNRRFRDDEPSCKARGSDKLLEAVRDGVALRRIDIKVEASICMAQCPKGPTMKLVPGGEFLLGRSVDDVEEVLDHLTEMCGLREEEDDEPLHLLGS